MAFVDEKIAQLEKARRRLKRDEQEKALIEKQKTAIGESVSLTLEDIQAGILANKVVLEDIVFTFEKQIYFEDKLPLLLMKDFFDEVKIEKQTLLFISNIQEVCIMCTYLEEKLPEKTLEVKQQELEENFLKMQMYAEIKKAVHLENLDYICYRTPTSKGWIYNIVYWIENGERRIVGNLNCLDKQQGTYGLLLEALVIQSNEMIK